MDPKVIWSLDQTWAQEEKWYLGSVEVTPIEAAEKPQYSVRSQAHIKLSVRFVYFYLQIVVQTSKFGNENSFVAVDQFEFLQISKCEIRPQEATPTPPPTEPPSRKID